MIRDIGCHNKHNEQLCKNSRLAEKDAEIKNVKWFTLPRITPMIKGCGIADFMCNDCSYNFWIGKKKERERDKVKMSQNLVKLKKTEVVEKLIGNCHGYFVNHFVQLTLYYRSLYS